MTNDELLKTYTDQIVRAQQSLSNELLASQQRMEAMQARTDEKMEAMQATHGCTAGTHGCITGTHGSKRARHQTGLASKYLLSSCSRGSGLRNHCELAAMTSGHGRFRSSIGYRQLG